MRQEVLWLHQVEQSYHYLLLDLPVPAHNHSGEREGRREGERERGREGGKERGRGREAVG